jgi:hypothetical protein
VLNERRLDFGESSFFDALEAVAAACQEHGQKVVVFLDGLDHVERDADIRDSIIEALPNELPPGALFVIGTQELHHWRPLALRKGREERHVKMPLFAVEETSTYVRERCELTLSDDVVARIHEKSGGLPLYLRYLTEIAGPSDSPETAIELIPAAVEGDIRSYYEMLWSAFDAEGRGDAKYLSAVLCSLRFSVHENELFSFQQGIKDRPKFEGAFRHVRHLLRVEDDSVAVFHSSFRVFVLDSINSDTRSEISSGIVAQLNNEAHQSPRWFRHTFQYALDAKDYAYVLMHVTRQFVDAALMRFRDEEEVLDAIDCAIEAAAATNDLVALSRLGSLKYRTNERFEAGFLS